MGFNCAGWMALFCGKFFAQFLTAENRYFMVQQMRRNRLKVLAV